MIYFLFVLLTILMIINYSINRNILIPSFIMCMSFWLVALIYVICSSIISDPIGEKTVGIIIFSILFFWCGEIIGNGICNRGNVTRYATIDRCVSEDSIEINNCMIVFFIILILVSAYIRMAALCNMVETNVSIKSFVSSYATIRFYLIHGRSPIIPKWTEYMPIIAPCIVRVCITVFSYNFIRYRIIQKKYLGVIVSFILYLVTSTSRTVFLDLVAYSIFQFFFLELFLFGKLPMIKWKTIKPVVLSVILFASCFSLIGRMAQKSAPIVETIFAYTAAAFIGLDNFLNNPYYAENILSSRTLQGVFSPFDRVGLKLPKLEEYLPHYFYLGGKATSNEYTSLMEPYHDFGLGGMLMSRVLLGVVFGLLLGYIVKQSNKGKKYYLIPMLGPVYYSLVLSAIDDQFSTLLSMYYIYQLIFTWIIWKACITIVNNRTKIKRRLKW